MENVSFVSFVFTIAKPALLVQVLLVSYAMNYETAEPQELYGLEIYRYRCI
jgi:hypothetical protein